MNKSLIAIAMTGPLLGACATTAAVNTGKALAAAWAGLDGASVAADAAVKAGKLQGPQAATVATDLRKADAALQAATSAYQQSTSTTDAATQVQIATTAIAEVVTIVGGLK